MPSSHLRRASSRRPGTNAQNVNRPMAVAYTCSGNRFDTFDQLHLPGSNSGPPQGCTADNAAGKQQNGSHIQPTSAVHTYVKSAINLCLEAEAWTAWSISGAVQAGSVPHRREAHADRRRGHCSPRNGLHRSHTCFSLQFSLYHCRAAHALACLTFHQGQRFQLGKE
jgi:hypothetical protein